MPGSSAQLASDALAHALAFLDDAADLLHAARVCRSWRRIIDGPAAEPAWRLLCQRHGYPFSPQRGPARLQFRASHEQVLKDRRLKRRVALMSARSVVAAAEREVASLRARRDAEAASNRRLRADAADTARRAAAQKAAQGWQLGVVKERHEQLLRPQPVAPEWRARNAQEAIKESDAHIASLGRGLRAAAARLKSARARLAALEGS